MAAEHGYWEAHPDRDHYRPALEAEPDPPEAPEEPTDPRAGEA